MKATEFSFSAPTSAEIKNMANIYRAIKHPLRAMILEFIHQGGTRNVTEIYVKFRVEQSVASQHLAILRKVGAVHTKRDGKVINYSVDLMFFNRLAAVNTIIK